MPALDYRELGRRIPMRRVLALLNYGPTSCRGAQWRGPCPICRAQTCDFSVHLDRNAFRCFHCGARGNQLQLWRLHLGLPLHAASLELCRRLSEPPPWLNS